MPNRPVKADRFVRCVCRDQEDRLEYLKLARDLDEDGSTFTVAQVIDLIDNKGEQIVIGKPDYPKVHSIKGKWLSTDPNSKTEDNLGEADACPDAQCAAIRMIADRKASRT
jgi:hypothetical protein